MLYRLHKELYDLQTHYMYRYKIICIYKYICTYKYCIKTTCLHVWYILRFQHPLRFQDGSLPLGSIILFI